MWDFDSNRPFELCFLLSQKQNLTPNFIGKKLQNISNPCWGLLRICVEGHTRATFKSEWASHWAKPTEPSLGVWLHTHFETYDAFAQNSRSRSNLPAVPLQLSCSWAWWGGTDRSTSTPKCLNPQSENEPNLPVSLWRTWRPPPQSCQRGPPQCLLIWPEAFQQLASKCGFECQQTGTGRCRQDVCSVTDGTQQYRSKQSFVSDATPPRQSAEGRESLRWTRRRSRRASSSSVQSGFRTF